MMNGHWLESVHPLLVLFGTIGLGLALGRVTVGGLNLGSSGVLFVALLAGHWGGQTYSGVGTIGLVLFVYAVGIGAGGRFFGALRREGSTLAQLSLLVTVSGAAIAIGCSYLLKIPAGLAAGLYAGALTSTPALAAATETMQEAGSQIPIGYGIAYPFGVIGVVVFVQLLPRLLKIDLEKEAAKAPDASSTEARIATCQVVVTNPELFGARIADFEELGLLGVQVTRVRKGERGAPLSYADTFSGNQELFLVGPERQLRSAVKLLGHESKEAFFKDWERERRQLIVLERAFSGKPLRELNLLRDHGITISRISRLGFTFVPNAETVLEANDVITVIGDSEAIERFSKTIGHRSQAFDETDLLSLGVGLSLGVVVGQLSFGLPGLGALSLGLAGGPLLVGLILGHFGKVGRIVGHIPRPTRIMLQEFGLVLFLTEAGIRGGVSMVETFQEYGLTLFLAGAAVTAIPLGIGYVVARYFFRLNTLQSLGGICGGMTSTPALGAITAKTDSQQPVVSYATAYPVALILMTILAKLLIQAVQAFGAG
jgi:putative transport protein